MNVLEERSGRGRTVSEVGIKERGKHRSQGKSVEVSIFKVRIFTCNERYVLDVP